MVIFTACGTAVRATPISQKKYAINQVARYYKLTKKESSAAVHGRASSAGKKISQCKCDHICANSLLFYFGIANLDSLGIDNEIRAKKKSSVLTDQQQQSPS